MTNPLSRFEHLLASDEITPQEHVNAVARCLAEAYRMKDEAAVAYLLRKNVEAVARLEKPQ